MRIGRVSRAVAALGFASGLTAGVLLATAGAAFADYGLGAEYQVEISANLENLAGQGQSTGGGVWFWAALNQDGTVNYQVTDCVHNFTAPSGPVPNGSSHNSGDTTWTNNDNGTLTINGVMTGIGPVSITVPSTDGHYVYQPGSLPPLFGGSLFSAIPAQVQVAP